MPSADSLWVFSQNVTGDFQCLDPLGFCRYELLKNRLYGPTIPAKSSFSFLVPSRDLQESSFLALKPGNRYFDSYLEMAACTENESKRFWSIVGPEKKR